MRGWGVLYRFILKIQYSDALTSPGYVFFALTASPGQPGCHTLQVAPQPKGGLKYSHLILVQPPGFFRWFDMVVDITFEKRVILGAFLSEENGIVKLPQTVVSSLNLTDCWFCHPHQVTDRNLIAISFNLLRSLLKKSVLSAPILPAPILPCKICHNFQNLPPPQQLLVILWGGQMPPGWLCRHVGQIGLIAIRQSFQNKDCFQLF